MAATSVEPPFAAFADLDGQALEDGYINVGVANLNPITNPIAAFFDDALTIPAVQPIRTLGGYPVYQGTPARFYVASDYSIQVKDKNGNVVYTSLNGNTGGGSMVTDATGDGVETVYVLPFAPNQIFINGAYQNQDTYTIAGFIVTFTQAPPLNAIIEFSFLANDKSKATQSQFVGVLPISKGGTGTATPNLVAGANVTISGSWPNQTIASASGVGTVTSVGGTGTVNGITLSGTVTSTGNLTLGGSLSGSAASLTGLPLTTGVTGILPIVNGGTNASTAATARSNILPSYAGNAGKVLAVNIGTTDVEFISAGGVGTVTSVAVSGGTTGLTTSGGPITAAGTITLAGTLAVANGGTGTSTPAIVAGTNVTVSGSWPNQTINATAGGSGTVTSVAATVPSIFSISGSPITTSGTLAMTYSGTALPVVNGGTGETSYTNGQLLIGNTTGNTLTKTTLTAGTGVTITNGTGSITIAASGGSGDVVGPASATDNAITRYDGTTGKLVQTSLVTVADDGAITAPSVGSVIPFYYANQAAFPSAVTYHGAIAHSHSDLAMYFAHSSAWHRLLDANTAVTVAQGGTGLTTTPANGALDIGNGTGFTRTTLTAGSGITITNGAGSISIASSGGTGDVVGPASAVANSIALFNSTTGKLIKDSSASDGLIYGLTLGRGASALSTNTAFGSGALNNASTTGQYNTAIGRNTMQSLTSGDESTAVGNSVLNLATTGGTNVGVGNSCLAATTTGSSNVAVGHGGLQRNTTASSNTAVGYQALTYNTTASNNTAVGYSALVANTTGTPNTAVGYQALNANTTGTNNTAIGQNALRDPTTASNNTVIGHRAGESLAGNGEENVLIGVNAGNYSTILHNGSQNVCIGTNVSTGSNNNNATITIGYQIQGQGNGYVTLGSPSGKVYNQFTTNATWTQTSDVRLKTNIQNDSLGLSFINRLRPVKFNWKPSNEIDQSLPQYGKVNVRNTDTVIHGLIAQEVKAAMDAENCSTFNGWTAGSENDDVQGLSREMFITPLIKAVQELTAQIENIKSEFDAYKATHP